MSLVLDEHRHYLSDDVKIDAYRRAIREIVRPGSVVCDLASGTSILGLLACQAGAARVYSVEITGMVEVARAIAEVNGLSDRLIPVQGESTEVALPERVDVIVCDQIGHFGVEAGLIEYGCDARDRFLKPGGIMMPSRVDLFVAPVESAEQFGRVEFWNRPSAGFDVSPVRKWAVNTGYPTTIDPLAPLGQAACAASIDMAAVAPAPFRLSARLAIERTGTLHGIGGWFSAQLSAGVTLSNGPGAGRLNRQNVFFPIDAPVAVLPGDEVAVSMHVIPVDTLVTWTAEILRGSRSLGRFRHSTLHGMLICREDLRRMNPGFVPTLTPRGLARLSVLELCDGRRPLAEIERELFRLHPGLFPTVADAGAFAAEVVTRYTV
jgi:Ribosomal protein L11 methyltransferase (PrmA)